MLKTSITAMRQKIAELYESDEVSVACGRAIRYLRSEAIRGAIRGTIRWAIRGALRVAIRVAIRGESLAIDGSRWQSVAISLRTKRSRARGGVKTTRNKGS